MSNFSNTFGCLGFEMFVPGQVISAGAFGKVYSCQSLDTRKEFAVKVEEVSNGSSVLSEGIILQQISGVDGIPKFKWLGSTSTYNMLVMERLGDSVSFRRRLFTDRKVPMKLILNVGSQCLNILESLHSKGFVHGDVKPSNMVFGHLPSNREKLYLVDFGYSNSYWTLSGAHMYPITVNGFVGTLMFASQTAHDYKLLSRRDDLISLGYTLAYLYYGTLPWIDYCIVRPVSQRNERMVYKMKKELRLENMPHCLKEFLLYSSELKYSEAPDYGYLRNLFQAVLDTFKSD